MLKKAFFSTTFIKFLAVGGFAAIVNFGSRIGFSYFFNYTTAIVLAYFVGIIIAFIFNKLFVFTHKIGSRSPAKQFYYFFLINLLGLAQTLVVSLLLAHILLPALGIEQGIEEIAHFIGICVPVFTSYLGHKYITFRTA
ncbi:GtrA family protein [Beggiatoa leptomitoformis]|uniref:GtrA family protein n=1 Tax=Beggiatoa leptomitoformis TaxID=288004 RepID=A0A2N9YE90_9GAMM|nr:GtrA family protein [Beggiatoa leptomitoformis]ALG68825.1 GtrA family protein [Beggiatoa leptomitoformis]AUI68811.1 GtrA family protein [Beggiatoa leptomitoformis]